MNAKKIRLIIEKEFDEIMKNKLVLSTLLLMPLLFAIVIPAAMILPAILSPDQLTGNETMDLVKNLPGAENMGAQEAYIVFMVSAILPFFMILPAILPTIISSYSIVGEKKNRTLEPLLAAPIAVEDILAGKALAALLPALVATWISAAVFAVMVYVLTNNIVHRILVPDTTWLIGLFILGPLVAFLGVMFTIIISSRVNDPRTAQQVSVIFILPIMAIFMAQMFGVLLINETVMLGVCVVVLIADVAVVKIGSDLFDREGILTRWK
ncbi:MAG: ABC transporter permease subunit [Methanocella sp.]